MIIKIIILNYIQIFKFSNSFSYIMYKRYLVIASKQDKAGMNIVNQLIQFRKSPVLSAMNTIEEPTFDIHFVDEDIIYDSNYEPEKINKYDFVIFASKHQSETPRKTLSIHAPGNPRNAEFGGQPGKLCPSSALFQKRMFEILNKNAKKHNLEHYEVTLECTHHGPLINKPCVFIEIGATDIEWSDRRASFVIATTIKDTIEKFMPNKYREIAIGVGGPHYCPSFNKIQMNSNIALSHIIPGYTLPLTEDMLDEAIKKTEEELDFVVLDWKGIANADERERIKNLLDRKHIYYKKTSDVEK